MFCYYKVMLIIVGSVHPRWTWCGHVADIVWPPWNLACIRLHAPILCLGRPFLPSFLSFSMQMVTCLMYFLGLPLFHVQFTKVSSSMFQDYDYIFQGKTTDVEIFIRQQRKVEDMQLRFFSTTLTISIIESYIFFCFVSFQWSWLSKSTCTWPNMSLV